MRRLALAILTTVVLWSAFAVITLLTGCPRPIPKTDPPRPVNVPTCPAGTAEPVAVAEDVCEGQFTSDGHACAVCKRAKACVSPQTEIYCTTGNCSDPLCLEYRPFPP